MKQDTGKRSLEGLKIFPYVAWALTIGFAVFVYTITTELQAVATELGQQSRALEAKVQNYDPQADFDTVAGGVPSESDTE